MVFWVADSPPWPSRRTNYETTLPARCSTPAIQRTFKYSWTKDGPSTLENATDRTIKDASNMAASKNAGESGKLELEEKTDLGVCGDEGVEGLMIETTGIQF